MGNEDKKKSKARVLLGTNLKILRKNAGKNIKQVAEETGLAYSFVYNLENLKECKNPSMETLDKLATYYCVEIYELFV